MLSRSIATAAVKVTFFKNIVGATDVSSLKYASLNCIVISLRPPTAFGKVSA